MIISDGPINSDLSIIKSKALMLLSAMTPQLFKLP